MSGNASTLANLITAYRIQAFLAPTLNPRPILAGAAQHHAQDMAAKSYVGLVASDGEDVFRRVVCSGGTVNAFHGAIAVGYSTSAQEVFAALQSDFSANAVLLYSPASWTGIGVGYKDGYWTIIMGF